MTVCIAAICEDRYIVGASDRMVHHGHTNTFYEPNPSKILPLTKSIAVLYSDDSSAASLLFNHVSSIVKSRDEAEGQWTVQEIVDLWHSAYQKEVAKRTEATLSPFSLDVKSFMTAQATMHSNYVNHLVQQMLLESQKRLEISVIIAGVDATGPHLFEVREKATICQDLNGFAAVGSGQDLAALSFVLAAHSRQRSFASTIYLTYAAKRYAEAAVGVGKKTDMFTIRGLGSFSEVELGIFRKLEGTYARKAEKVEAIDKNIEDEVASYLSQ